MEPYESISLYRNQKALTQKGRSQHLNEYDITSDIINKDGTRIITMKVSDKTEHLALCKELADNMVERLGEGDNKLLRTMLLDTLRDFEEKDIKDMHKRVITKKEPVKYKEGCFKLIIGDGRKRNHHEIMLIT